MNFVEMHYLSMGPELISFMLGRSAVAVLSMAKKLKCMPKRAPAWSYDEKNILYQYYQTSTTMQEIMAMLPGRAKTSVFTMAKVLGLSRPSPLWSPGEIQILKRYYPSEGKSVIRRLPGRSTNTVASKASELGIRFENGDHHPWNEDDWDKLQRHQNESIIALRRLFPERSKASLRTAKYHLKKRLAENTNKAGNISADTTRTGMSGKNKIKVSRWTDAEKNVLITWYETNMPMTQILQMLPGRAKKSVFAMAETLELIRPVGWSPEELEVLKVWYPSEGGLVKKRLPGRTANAIRIKAWELKIRRERG